MILTSSELFIVGGTLINGDGHSTQSNATIHVVGDQIVDIDTSGHRPRKDSTTSHVSLIDAAGGFVIPGVVNGHAHGCTTGPLFSSAALPLDAERVRQNADRHLTDGVTTLINLCGLGSKEDLTVLDDHPLRTFISTTHFPEAIQAARIVDGAGLTAQHEALSAEYMLATGQAVAIGEVGSGATLGGGVASYKYVPQAVGEIFNKTINAAQATQLIDSLLGPNRQSRPSDEAFYESVMALELVSSKPEQSKAVAKLKEAIVRYAQKPLVYSLKTFDSAAQLSAKTGDPAIFHTAMPSVAKLLEVAEDPKNQDATLIAGHMNHTSIPLDQMLIWAEKLKAAGVVIDVSILDSVHLQALVGTQEIDALMASGLVDVLSTDYAAGNWDSILEAIERWWQKGLITLPRAVEIAAAAPAALFPKAAHKRGRLMPGYFADIVITKKGDIGNVRTVIIDGQVVRQATD